MKIKGFKTQKETNHNLKFNAELQRSSDRYVAKVTAINLLALERGLQEYLKKVQGILSSQYSEDDKRSVREVLENGK